MADLRDRAIKAFQGCLPTFYQQCKPLLDPLISLIGERIHLNLGTDDLPHWRNEETTEQFELRNKIVGHLMSELRNYNRDIDFDEDYENDIFTIVIYWYLKDYSAKFLRERKDCEPNSFFGDRDPQTGELRRPDYFDKDQTAPPRAGVVHKKQYPLTNTGTREHKIQRKRKAADDCSQEELSKRYLSLVQNKPVQQTLCHGEHKSNIVGDARGYGEERAPLTSHSNDDFECNEGNEESERRLQEKLSARYLSRVRRQARCDQRAAPDVALPEERSTNLERIATRKVLRHVLEKTEEEFHERYGAFIGLHGMNSVQDMLEAALTPSTRSVMTALETGSIGISELRDIGGNPREEDGPGVYLHILWTGQGKFWLYIGQSINLRDRIQKHCDQKHRKLNPSLHYSVWDSGDIIGDTWVTLSLFPSLSLLEDDRISHLTVHERELLLNLEEMYLACVFQTLRRHHLERYLPTGTSMPWAGSHLNLALPLWQGFSTQSGDVVTRQTFVDAIHSSDPRLRKWAASWRNAYNSLRHSPDLRLRDYWAQNMAIVQNAISTDDGLKPAQEGVQKAKRERYHELLNSGRALKVRQWATGGLFLVLSETFFVFPISKTLQYPCKAGDEIFFYPLLFQSPQEFPFARKALTTDPASRLIIAVNAKKEDKDHWAWLFTYGKRAVLGMNTFVDCLEGLTFNHSQLLPRRLIPRYGEDGKRTVVESDPETLVERAIGPDSQEVSPS